MLTQHIINVIFFFIFSKTKFVIGFNKSIISRYVIHIFIIESFGWYHWYKRASKYKVTKYGSHFSTYSHHTKPPSWVNSRRLLYSLRHKCTTKHILIQVMSKCIHYNVIYCYRRIIYGDEENAKRWDFAHKEEKSGSWHRKRGCT